MDHEVVPCSSNICDWLLNSSHDCFDLCQEKNIRSDHDGTWRPQKASFQAYIIHYHGLVDCVVGEAKEVLSPQM